jgi:Domain of unknown function (DUF929)
MPESGPDDGDVIELGPEKPPRAWVIGGRTRLIIVAGVCVLLAVGVTVATVAAVRLSAPSPAQQALAKLVAEVTSVPASETVPLPMPTVTGGTVVPVSGDPDTQSPPISSGSVPVVSSGSLTSPAATGPRLTADGKPEVLYVNEGFCPYCVAESWPLIVALSHFGAFSGLSTTRSPFFDDVLPVDGWTFYGSSYVSRYLTFVPVETRSSLLINPKADADPESEDSFRVLQRLTPAQESVYGKIDPLRQTPLLDFGGKAVLIGSGLSPYLLRNLTWSQIAADLRRPQTEVGAGIVGAVDMLTGEICRLTGDRPAAVCRH